MCWIACSGPVPLLAQCMRYRARCCLKVSHLLTWVSRLVWAAALTWEDMDSQLQKASSSGGKQLIADRYFVAASVSLCARF